MVTSKKLEFKLKPRKVPSSPQGLFRARLPTPSSEPDQEMDFEEVKFEKQTEDFHIRIDVTYLLAQLPSYSVPPSPRFAIPKHLRPDVRTVADGVKAPRGGWSEEFPNSTAYGSDEDGVASGAVSMSINRSVENGLSSPGK